MKIPVEIFQLPVACHFDQRVPLSTSQALRDLLQFHVDLLAGVVWRHASHEDLAIVLEVAQARLAEALHHHHGIEHGLPNLGCGATRHGASMKTISQKKCREVVYGQIETTILVVFLFFYACGGFCIQIENR